MTPEEMQKMFGWLKPNMAAVGGVPMTNPMMGGTGQAPQAPVAPGGFDLGQLVNNPASQGLGRALNAQAQLAEGQAGARHITGVSPDVQDPFKSGFFNHSAPPRQDYTGIVNDVRGRQAADLHPDIAKYVGEPVGQDFVGPLQGVRGGGSGINPAELVSKPYNPTPAAERGMPTTRYQEPVAAAPAAPNFTGGLHPNLGPDFQNSPIGKMLLATILKRGEPFPR